MSAELAQAVSSLCSLLSELRGLQKKKTAVIFYHFTAGFQDKLSLTNILHLLQLDILRV